MVKVFFESFLVLGWCDVPWVLMLFLKGCFEVVPLCHSIPLE